MGADLACPSDARARAAVAHQQAIAVRLLDVKDDALLCQRIFRSFNSLSERHPVNMWRDALGQMDGHLVEDQVGHLAAAATGHLLWRERDDLLDQPVGNAAIVLREQALARFAQREEVVGPAGAAAHLLNVDVAVARQDVQVTADGRGRQA